MNIFRFLLCLSLVLPFFPVQAGETTSRSSSDQTEKIEVYYFHFTARCITCKAVEAQTQENLTALFPDLIKQGKLSFQSVNLDDVSSEKIANKLQVDSQSLLIVKGKSKKDLTNDGFLYAKTNPEKFKAILKNQIEAFMKL